MAKLNQLNNMQPMNSGDIPWIHCNSCYKIFDKINLFYLLSCCDVMCRNCFRNGGRTPFCTLCKKSVAFKIINEKVTKFKIFIHKLIFIKFKIFYTIMFFFHIYI